MAVVRQLSGSHQAVIRSQTTHLPQSMVYKGAKPLLKPQFNFHTHLIWDFTRTFSARHSPFRLNLIRLWSGSYQTVVRQSSRSHQEVFRQLSDSLQAVIRQSSGSHQAVFRQSSGRSRGSHQVVIKQALSSAIAQHCRLAFKHSALNCMSNNSNLTS